MKNFLKISAFSILFATLLAFHPAPDNALIGTYSVSENDPSQIQLILNEDHTFSYRDYSIASSKINIKGKWEAKGNTFHLLSTKNDAAFPKKWKIDSEGKIAKSRKGMCFYTLQKQ